MQFKLYVTSESTSLHTLTGFELTVITSLMDQHNILIIGLQEIRNTEENALESQEYRHYKVIPWKRAMKSVPQFQTVFYGLPQNTKLHEFDQ